MAELRNGTSIQSIITPTVPIMTGRASYAAKHKLADHFIGGNKLENAVTGPVKDFVAAHDGHTVITNVSPPCAC
jgi:acetyl-CoA carboxylase/biotin carboxylase 1